VSNNAKHWSVETLSPYYFWRGWLSLDQHE
jgi:hypothetical protein